MNLKEIIMRMNFKNENRKSLNISIGNTMTTLSTDMVKGILLHSQVNIQTQ